LRDLCTNIDVFNNSIIYTNFVDLMFNYWFNEWEIIKRFVWDYIYLYCAL